MEDATFTIYSMGDAGWIRQVLTAVSMTTGYGMLAFAGALIGLIVMAIMVARDGGKAFTPQDFLIGVAIFTLFFGSRVDGVMIQDWQPDPISGYQQTYVVDDVPAGLAVLGTGLSSLGVYIAELYEQNFSDASASVRASGGGYGYSLERFSRLRDLASASVSDPDGVFDTFREFGANYLRDCTMKGVQAKEKKESDIYKAKNPIQGIRWDHPWFVTEAVDPGGARELVSCSDASSRLQAVAAQLDEALDSVSESGDGRMRNVGEISTQLLAGTLGQSAVTMQDFIASLILSRLIAAEAAEGGGFSESAVAMTAIMEQAAAQRNVQWVIEDSMWRRVLRPVTSFFEALCYALAPAAAFLFGLGRAGWSLASKYLILPVWVVLFFPLVAITDGFGQRKFKFFLERYRETFEGLDSGATSIAGMNEIMINAMDAIGTSAMLGASVPALALMLLFGGAVTATHLAGRFQGGDFVDEKVAAPDTAKVAPVMSVEGQRDVDAFGSTLTAAAGGLRQYSRADALSQNVRSADVEAYKAGDAYASKVAQQITELFKIGKDGEKAFLSNFAHALHDSKALQAKLGVTFDANNGWQVTTASTDENAATAGIEARAGIHIGGNGGASGSAEGSAPIKETKMAPLEKGIRQVLGAATKVAGKANILIAVAGAIDAGAAGTFKNTESSKDSETIARDTSNSTRTASSRETALARDILDTLSSAVTNAHKDVGSYAQATQVGDELSRASTEAWEKAKAFEVAQGASSQRGVVENVSENEIYTKMVAQTGRENTHAFIDFAEGEIRRIGLGGSLARHTDRLDGVVGDASEAGMYQLRAAAIMATLDNSGRHANPDLLSLPPEYSDDRTVLHSQLLDRVFNSGEGSVVDGGAEAYRDLYTTQVGERGGAAERASAFDGPSFTSAAVKAAYQRHAGAIREAVDGATFKVNEGRVAVMGGEWTPQQRDLLEQGAARVIKQAETESKRQLDESEVNILLSGYMLAAQQAGKRMLINSADPEKIWTEGITPAGAYNAFMDTINREETRMNAPAGRRGGF